MSLSKRKMEKDLGADSESEVDIRDYFENGWNEKPIITKIERTEVKK